MKKFVKIILILFFTSFLWNGTAAAGFFPNNVQNDVWSGVDNDIPTARDGNDGVPDIFDAVNLLINQTFTANMDVDDRLVDPDADNIWTQTEEISRVALIGLTAANSNTIGFYTDLGTGSTQTDILGSMPAFGFQGDGLTSATAFTGATFSVNSDTFGWYLRSENGTTNTFFSEPGLNSDGWEHMMTFGLPELEEETRWIKFGGGAQLFEFINPFLITWEDLNKGGDQDYDDMIYIFARVEPVPEPATMLLVGSGLIGLAGIGRRKFFKKS